MSTDALNDNQANDQQLWDDFRQGNQQAFAQLYEQYIIKLYNYGFQLIKDPDMVQDAIQELFSLRTGELYPPIYPGQHRRG